MSSVGDDPILKPLKGLAEGTFGKGGGIDGVGVLDSSFFEFAEDEVAVEGEKGDELAAASDGWEQGVRLMGEEDDESAADGFFESFEDGILGGVIHQFGLLDDEDFSASHGGFSGGGFDKFGSDDVDGEIDALGLAGFVINADQLFGNDVAIGVVASGESYAGRTMAAWIGGSGSVTEE